MSVGINFSRRVWVLGLFISLISLSGCVEPANEKTIDFAEDAHKKGRLSFFLNLQSVRGPNVAMTISTVELLPESGKWESKDLDNLLVDAGTIRTDQKFLSRMVLPPGKYSKIRFVIESAQESKSGDRTTLTLKDSKVELNLHRILQISEGDSKSLFLTWDTKESLQEGVFYPILRVAPKLKKLIADVAYVACPDIDTVFMINTKENRVVDSLGIQGQPRYLYESKLRGKDKVYALTSSELIAFSPSTNNIIERNNLSMIKQPVHMALSPDGRWAYILDQQRNSVSKMEIGSGAVETQVRLDHDPAYILYLEKRNMLVVSQRRGQSVVALDPENLTNIGSISTGMMPEGLMEADDRYLYIAESGSNSVMVYDFENNVMVKRIPVGFLPKRVALSTTSAYVANQGSRDISILHTGAGILRISRNINFPGQPLEMAYVFKNKWLYVGNGTEMSINIIESTTNEIVGEIELGAPPAGIVVLQ